MNPEELAHEEASMVNIDMGDRGNIVIVPKHLEGDRGASAEVGAAVPASSATPAEFVNIQCDAQTAKTFEPVWSSRGTMSAMKASVWAPTTAFSSYFRRANQVRVSLGHCISFHYREPKLGVCLKLTDTYSLGMVASPCLASPGLDQLLPKPARSARFRQLELDIRHCFKCRKKSKLL
jgi:hypothetical protein